MDEIEAGGWVPESDSLYRWLGRKRAWAVDQVRDGTLTGKQVGTRWWYRIDSLERLRSHLISQEHERLMALEQRHG